MYSPFTKEESSSNVSYGLAVIYSLGCLLVLEIRTQNCMCPALSWEHRSDISKIKALMVLLSDSYCQGLATC